jgi:hypothetical protein
MENEIEIKNIKEYLEHLKDMMYLLQRIVILSLLLSFLMGLIQGYVIGKIL